MRHARTAAAIVAAAVAAACAGASRPRRIEIHDFAFVPGVDTLPAGGEVVFVNRDAVPHTATAADGAWDTRAIAAGDSAVVRVARGGRYRCAFHPTMTATLVAEK